MYKNLYIVTALVVISATVIFAQKTVAHDDKKAVNPSNSTFIYCRLFRSRLWNGYGDVKSDKLWVDYGNTTKYMESTEEGKKVGLFQSEIDALNYMTEKGWEFAHLYKYNFGSGDEVIYTLRRKVDR